VDCERTLDFHRWSSVPKSTLLFFALLILVSCSPSTRSLFFDIPPPKPEPVTTQAAETAAAVSPGASSAQAIPTNPADIETDRPPIEDTLDWSKALELLPKTARKQPDWSAALREGVIKPRALNPGDRDADFFKLDFYLRGKKEAFFPHSSHVAWMGCDSCHPAVFKYRDNEISMKAIKRGEYCGVCHGKNKVAFDVKDCNICHR